MEARYLRSSRSLDKQSAESPTTITITLGPDFIGTISAVGTEVGTKVVSSRTSSEISSTIDFPGACDYTVDRSTAASD